MKKYKPYIVLGIYEVHMASAAIMIDGKLIAAEHEERFSKIKNDVGLPIKSIKFCLKTANIKPSEIDEVILSNLNFNKNGVSNILLKRQALYSVEDWIKENNIFWKKIFYSKKKFKNSYFKLMGGTKKLKKINHYYNLEKINLNENENKLKKKFNLCRKNALNELVGIDKNKIKFVDHFLCHHYHAYYSSPFKNKNTAIIHLEGDGGKFNNAVSLPTENGIKVIEGSKEANVGRLYQWITLLLGMKPYHHEYKIMGLSPYANKQEMQKSLKVFKNLFKLSKSKLTIVKKEKPKDLFYYFLKKLKGHRFDGIAGALQKNTENIIFEWVKNVSKITKRKYICYGGGVAMNVKANLLCSNLKYLKKFYVPLAPSDESNAIGACYYGTEKNFIKRKINLKNVETLNNPYLGSEINKNSEEIYKYLKKNLNFKFKFYNKVSSKFIAMKLANGKILGRFVGRSEFGQRALGNRSILADPSNINIKKKINELIKQRDFWMPFCPSILNEYKDKVLINPKNNPANFMTIAFPVSKKFRKKLIGVIHEGDQTCRPHIVEKKFNDEFHQLIKEFYKLKKIPALLNTSFNLHGKPIVSDLKDLVYFLNNSNIDGVIINKSILLRK